MDGGPVDLVFVRHGESEGNLAQYRSHHGNEADWTPDFANRHSSKYRLTDEGRKQAQFAGAFVKENIYNSFDKLVSIVPFPLVVVLTPEQVFHF
jgi:broad specificity phosphatase PhoE